MKRKKKALLAFLFILIAFIFCQTIFADNTMVPFTSQSTDASALMQEQTKQPNQSNANNIDEQGRQPMLYSVYKLAPTNVTVTIKQPYLISFGGTGLTWKYIAVVNGHETPAFCLDSDKYPPYTNNTAQSLPMTDRIAHNMYYCYGYPGEKLLRQWLIDNGFRSYTENNQFYALSHVLLSYTNNPKGAFVGWNQNANAPGGVLNKSYQEMIKAAYNYVSSLPLPARYKEDISFTSSQANWSGSEFKSGTIKFEAAANNYVNYLIPSDMTLYMNGTSYRGGTNVKITGGSTFYLTTKDQSRAGKTYVSPVLTGALKGYIPYKAPGDINVQAAGFFAATQTKTTKFSVRFSLITGNVKIKKVPSSDRHLVSLCPQQYSLEGAEYAVYLSQDDARADVNRQFVLRTQRDGATGTIAVNAKLNNGNYFTKEIKAPKGFVLSSRIYSFKIIQGQTTVVDVDDKPYTDPMTLVMQKKIKDGDMRFQKYMEGAEYTVRYYPQHYKTSEELKGKTPLRTWIFKTDKNGIIKINDAWKTGGDALFINDNGISVGLIGTYTFEETKAPSGFIKNNGLEIRQLYQGMKIDEITAENSPIFRELPDKRITRSITVKKNISSANVYKPYGYPTAIFELSGMDIYGKTYRLRKAVILDQTTLKNGYYSGSVVFDNLEAGEYTIRELDTSRYKIKSISNVSINGKINSEKVDFELVNSVKGYAEYENEISIWRNTSHRTAVINRL